MEIRPAYLAFEIANYQLLQIIIVAIFRFFPQQNLCNSFQQLPLWGALWLRGMYMTEFQINLYASTLILTLISNAIQNNFVTVDYYKVLKRHISVS